MVGLSQLFYSDKKQDKNSGFFTRIKSGSKKTYIYSGQGWISLD